MKTNKASLDLQKQSREVGRELIIFHHLTEELIIKTHVHIPPSLLQSLQTVLKGYFTKVQKELPVRIIYILSTDKTNSGHFTSNSAEDSVPGLCGLPPDLWPQGHRQPWC